MPWAAKAKYAIQGLVRRYPSIRRSGLYFRVQRYRQYRPLRIDASLTTRKDVLEALMEDGVCLLPAFISKEDCDTILGEIRKPIEQVVAGTFKGLFQNLDGDQYRIGNADTLSGTARASFFENEVISSIAKAFVSRDVVSYRREIDYKPHARRLLAGDLPHFDDWRHRFKALLYLQDVDEKNGPFVYYQRSHLAGAWKERYFREYEADGDEGRYGYFFPHEMKRILREQGFKERMCLGTAGTVILADFRGIHRGTMLEKGERVILNNVFGITLPGIL
jgi:hypothetical protein